MSLIQCSHGMFTGTVTFEQIAVAFAYTVKHDEPPALTFSYTALPMNSFSRQWNERLFAEMYKAYKTGRADKDPTEFWYKGEIGFFDFYIIPLAKRLKEVEVFGGTADECLQFAMKNREEWQVK
jgi:hypothetical protein